YFDTLTCCPSRLSSGSSEEDLAEDMAAESDSTEALSAEYTALVDGGDTEDMNEDILFSIPPEALSLQQQLLGESPYLSDTVMQSAVAKEEVLPNAMIRDILVANPQSAKSTRVMDELNNRFVPMPEPMMEEILEGQTTISAKEVLEGRISWHHANRTQLFYERMRRYKADTLNPEASFSSLVALLQQESTLPSRYKLAFEYLAKGDTTLALSTLDAIPSAFTLSADQQTEYEGYQDLMDLYIDLRREGKSVLELSSQQIATLETLTSTQSEPLSALARNALRANGTMDYYEPILLPDLTKSAPQKPETKTGKINTASYFTLFPNPANDYLILEYSIPGDENQGNQAIFVITSAEGKQIKTIAVQPGQNQLLVPITGLKAGQYLCTLKQHGKPLQSEKFIIIR
ncbi:MAG: T9SS type A sorting domain-containing protein, partial [Bacteroidales bacterium]|nr:T9SS type A sorting domain-containing protein [Bacteroidales bacterium]